MLRLPIALFILASAVDLRVTQVLLQHGLGWEANPVARAWIDAGYGLTIYKALIVSGVLFCAWLLARRRPKMAEGGLFAGTLLTLAIVLAGLLTVR